MACACRIWAQTPLPPNVTLTATNAQKQATWAPYPAADIYTILWTANLGVPFATNFSGSLTGFTWQTTTTSPAGFYQLQVTPMNSNALLTANVLNRLAYGPTPDELERVLPNPQAYVVEQLAPENIVENSDAYVSVTTNGVTLPPRTNWSFISVTGAVTSSTLYMYLTGVGDVYMDDVQLLYSYVITAVTNTGGVLTTNVYTNLTGNLVVNGNFEQPLTTGWTVAANLVNSYIASNIVCSGAGSLRMISTAPGATQGSAIWQTLPAAPTTTRGTNGTGQIYTNTVSNLRAMLSFAYLQSAYSHMLTLRLSGSGTIITALDAPSTPTWIYASATGYASNSTTLYFYLSGAGEAYVDDVKLVAGSVAEAGPNLIPSGNFEAPLGGAWLLTGNHSSSSISSNFTHAGGGSLKIVATGAGSGNSQSVAITGIAGVANRGTYTVSFWYIPGTRGRTLTVRFSAVSTPPAPGYLNFSPDTTLSGIRRRLETIGGANIETGTHAVQSFGGANLFDLRAWLVLNAVGSKRQLLEVLTQFLENHFVTQHSKSVDFFDGPYDDGNLMDILATDWEYREVSKWRAALLRPDCTFYDLLRISAESPAMIIYLDTVDSRGDGRNIANENYARELFELFCLGVDNGYDQHDIEAQSRAWTGWRVDIVDRDQVDNPLAPPSSTYGFYPGVGFNATSNKVGVWAFNYKSNFHGGYRIQGTATGYILSDWAVNSASTNLIRLGPKRVPARFGPPWANQPYELAIPPRTANNGIQDGYDVIGHLATNVPMTAEYICVKLCRLFVHDDFPNPTTRPELPEYAFYDYTNPNLSPEARLVHDCMLAWWNSNPRGNIRAVLNTIFNSELFRSHGGSLHKVKTPLEYTVSAIRALRSANPNGTFTASTDGYSISGRSRTAGSAPLTRIGTMMLFDRDAPDGYPEAGSPWISAGTLAERIRFVQTTLMATTDAAKGDGISGGNFNLTDPVGLLKRKLAAGSWNNASAVADYFTSVLYPGEGRANLDLYRRLAVDFLNTADNGVTPSLFSSLSNTSAGYDTRVRGMVALLMSCQRFQEQ